MNLEGWKEDVRVNCHTLETLMKDRVTIRREMTNHLKNFFGFDEIEFTDDFNKITLKWGYLHDPVIRQGSLEGLGMDFIITQTYDSKLGQSVVLELYPFGLPEGEET